ncbi:MAG: SgcJ/EcaC family oxidoreductase [Gemmatimonadetes bacterium]|nr:SgcJ/EcaC family oxidoreductase [Gemmatimonadota bacterium]NIO31716.1 SgcJ/EcaC family oxidoreductase [Gemmatimonadota bacterium]
MKITKLALVLVLVPCLGLVACAEQAGEEGAQTMEMAMTVDLEAVAEAFAAARAEYVRAFEAGDAAALAALYTEDAIRLPPDAEVLKGRAALEQGFAAAIAESTSRELTITQTDMGASGNLAYSIGTFSATYHVEGVADPVMDEGEYLVVSKLTEDGTWKIYAHMSTSSLLETQ